MTTRLSLLVLLVAFAAWIPVLADEPSGDGASDASPDAWKREYEPMDDSWKTVKQELIFNTGSEPETLDPARMTGVPEHRIQLALTEGLVTADPETLEARPGVAERWEVSDDGKVYTFHLRKDAKWSNGDPLRAEDFSWSWYRVVTHSDADYAFLIYDTIEGGPAFRKHHIETSKSTGKSASYEDWKKMVKAEAIDPHTFRVTLINPTAYFLDLTMMGALQPVHRKTVEADPDRWTQSETWVGNGPFTLQEWSPRDKIVMVPNKHYWDADFVKLKKITALPLEDQDVAYKKFINGEVHWITAVATAKLDDARKRPEYYVMPYLGSYFYRFNVTREHLNKKKVRKALSLAVNRKSITNDVTKAGHIPATYFCPPIEQAHYTPPKGYAYDPDKARKLFAEAGYPGGKGFPKLTIFYNSNDDHKKVAEAIAQMWRETLGIQVALQNSEWKVYLDEVDNMNYQVARAGWIGDFADPMTFLDMWLTNGGNNNTGWSNKRYDELIYKARAELDMKKRAQLLLEAEKIVVEDEFPILPLYIYVNQGMKVDGLQGWYENVRDRHPFQYLYFEPEE
ncbi:MAG: peptide ABC transporter substrate-binding protein [Planctomycetota bacterium]